MSADNQDNGSLDREWSQLQEYQRHEEGWRDDENPYVLACTSVMSEEGYEREVWELSPFITYMLLSRHYLDRKAVRREIRDYLETTIEAVQLHLPKILADVEDSHRVRREAWEEEVRIREEKAAKRAEARKRRSIEKASR